jgi:hypothetical protein
MVNDSRERKSTEVRYPDVGLELVPSVPSVRIRPAGIKLPLITLETQTTNKDSHIPTVGCSALAVMGTGRLCNRCHHTFSYVDLHLYIILPHVNVHKRIHIQR